MKFLLIDPLFAVLMALFVFDVASTSYALLKWPGRVREVMPVQRWFIDKMGVLPGTIILHVLAGGAIYFVWTQLWMPTRWCMILIYVLVALNNWHAIKSLRMRYGTS